MNIEIRPLKTIKEYQAVEQIQRQVWHFEDVKIVPDHMLFSIQKSGGLVLGAFDIAPGQERLVGFLFGLVQLTAVGQVKHWSDMAGVLPAYQNQNLGYQLKLAQRECVLAQGIDHIRWTFDPLESRNARLNFRKLGVTCNTYLRDVYGDRLGELNAGLPSDRFQVDWRISSAHVAERLRGDWVGPVLAALRAEGVAILNPALSGEPPRQVLPIEGDRILVQIPAHFQSIKSADLKLACDWRTHTCELFEAVFDAGYTIVDLLFENNQSYYLLRKENQNEN
ncbi:MAG: hypothetical protein DRI81_05050 [Chloroflexi bacterium]|nr:MAG: hypothetical protein DRI81_05050 [Chloroflexota bacterium]